MQKGGRANKVVLSGRISNARKKLKFSLCLIRHDAVKCVSERRYGPSSELCDGDRPILQTFRLILGGTETGTRRRAVCLDNMT
jgi:hypothetical protein